MEAIGLLVTLEARPGKEADAEAFLKSAQPLALNEKGTLKWYAIKLGPGKFGIFDTFANEGGRNAHLTGEIAKALGARANELFAAPPQIEKMEVLASTPLKQVQSVGDNSITIQNKSGVFHINITQPLTTYKVVPSDLNHITDNDYIGVASTQASDGTEVAKQIFVFPSEFRGAVEGSVLVDPQPGSAAQSRMTNGSVSLRHAAESHSRMTNGVVQKGRGTTLVVRYQDGEQTISVPAKVPVVGVVPGEVQLAAGETAYAKTDKQADGTLTTHMILVIGGPSSGNGKWWRLAYFLVAVAGLLAVATGWAIHKPAQLSWLTAIFGGFDNARVWHFWLMGFFIVFVTPHVVLVLADGWGTLRSMITGCSTKFKRSKVSDHEL
jgi:quinol monooxygenase YgiN